jgi:hypothetical protein
MTAAHLENPHAGQGMVLLDIGGDVGALVVTMPPAMAGVEVEIRPEGTATPAHPHGHAHGHGHEHEHAHGHGRHPHVAVVNRPVAGGEVPSLVFPELVTGRYELYVKETTEVRLVVDVTGGRVATAVWPG